MTNKILDYDFQIKSANDQTRVITAVCSSKNVDRQGDTVDVSTATWGKNIPLLLNHKLDQPAIGTVTSLVVRGDMLLMTATIPTIETDCDTKNALQDIWERVKHGLLHAVSIGFSANVAERTESGFAYSDISIHEISLCNVGANQDALVLSTSNAKAMNAANASKAASKHVTVSLNPAHHATKAATRSNKAGHGVAIALPTKSMSVELPQHLKKYAAKASCLSVTKRLEISHAISANYTKEVAAVWLELTHELRGIK